MATLQWDHAVQFVNQPEAAIEIFAGQQLRAVAGGRHPGWGTRNALSYFGLTYIEFLAIADPDELRAATDKFLLSRDAARLLPENEALTLAYRSIQGGARGLDMGRNIFQSNHPVEMAKAIRMIVHHKATDKEAFEFYTDAIHTK